MMQKEPINTKEENEEKALIRFLKKTKDGHYAIIDETSLAYSRIREERETNNYIDEEFYYNIS